jgi:hypothetical protein
MSAEPTFNIDKIVERNGKKYTVPDHWSDEHIDDMIAFQEIVDCDLCKQKMEIVLDLWYACLSCQLSIYRTAKGVVYKYNGSKYTKEEWQRALELKAFL